MAEGVSHRERRALAEAADRGRGHRVEPFLGLLAETMRFFAEESCQKCTPCRIGNRALHHVAEELEHGRAAMTRQKVDEWLEAMAQTSICGLGQASPIPVRNVFQHWPELMEALA